MTSFIDPDESQPFDDRHEPGKPRQYMVDLPEPGLIGDGRMRMARPGYCPGLHFLSEGPSGAFEDIGRTFNREGDLSGVDTLDLRVILAHLDSAAKAIQTELGRR